MKNRSIYDMVNWPTTEEIEARRQARACIWRGVKKTVKWTLITAGIVAIAGSVIPCKENQEETNV